MGAVFELRSQRLDVGGCCFQQALLDHFVRHWAAAAQRFVQQGQGMRFGVASVGSQRSGLPAAWFYPTGGNGHQFLVQAFGAVAVQRQAAEQNHAGYRILGLRETRPRKVVVDETLGAETCQEPLRHTLFQVQMHGVVRECASILEYHRADGRFLAPVRELLVQFAGRAQGVQRGGPTRVGFGPLFQRRKSPDRAAMLVLVYLKRRCAEQFQRTGERISKRWFVESHPSARAFQQRSAALDLAGQISLPLAGILQLRGRGALACRIQVRSFDLGLKLIHIVVANAATVQPPFHVVVDHFGQAAKLSLDSLGLRHQHLQHAIFHPLRKNEIVAAHHWRRLELAVYAAVALLDAARIPRQIEVEQVRAVGLEVQAFAGGIRGDENAQRVPGGVGVEATLHFLAARAAGEAIDHTDAFLGVVRVFDGLFQHGSQIAFGAFAVLREDEDAAVVPRWWTARRALAERWQVGALVGANPVDQAARLGIRLVAGFFGDGLHFRQQRLFAFPQGNALGVYPGRQGDGFELLRLERLGSGFVPLGAFVVRSGGLEEGVFVQRGRCLALLLVLPRLVPMPPDGAFMHLQAACERFRGRKQPLLQAHHQQVGRRPLFGVGLGMAFFTQRAVTVQQVRKNQFRRVRRQVVDHHRHHFALRKAAAHGADVLLQAPHHHRLQVALATHFHATGEAVRVKKFQERREAVGVAVVGRGGKKQAVLEASAQISHGAGELGLDAVAAAGRRRGVVRFVQNQQAAGQRFAQPLAQRVGVGRVDQEVVGDQKAAVRTPRVHAETALPTHPRNVGAVENLEQQAKAVFKFRLPLFQHGRRRRHHDALHLAAQQQFAGDEGGFDGLAKAGVVGDEEVHAGQQERLAQRLHLVGV